MNDDQTFLHRLLGGLVPPEPPRELEAKVLGAAAAALTRPRRRDAWTRIWESRPVRVAWAAAVLALLVANTVLPGRRAQTVRAAAPEAPRETDELGAIARLPRIDLGTLPPGAAPAPPAAGRTEPAHSRARTKESTS